MIGQPRKRRCHLLLTVELWDALLSVARGQGVSVSSVVQERLSDSLGIGSKTPAHEPMPAAVTGDRGHRCRVSIDSLLWMRLSGDATRRGMSVGSLIRERLREAVLGVSGAGPPQPIKARGLDEPSRSHSEVGSLPKPVIFFDLSDPAS